ncbi:MAG: dynamin family protein [Bacteroidota bacterium]
MAQDILATDLQPIRIQLDELTKNIHQMTIDTGLESLAQAVSELRNTLHEPFLFVIVGEVKAGKSSFINALLATGKEVVKVAPDPCTDTIQQVMYGAEPQTIAVNAYLKKIQQPVEILKHISVVDTPGTNTISDHHQEITEGFVPRSDLIVFVFEAKNPYRQSAWEFFDYIHADWRKKVIFVLQQADLMNEADLKVNIEGVSNYARKKGIEDPLVFALSAKLEQEGDHKGSRFGPLKQYLRENITGRQAHVLKLVSNLDTAENIQGKVYQRLEAMETQLKADRDFRADVIHTLRDQEGRSQRQVEGLIDQLLGEYDRLTQEAAQELDQGLGFFTLTKKSFLSVFSKQDSPQVWLKGLTERLQLQLSNSYTRKLNDGVEEIADSIGQMARIIDLKIKNSQTALKPAQDIFGEISDRRRMVLRDLQDGFTQFMLGILHKLGKAVL